MTDITRYDTIIKQVLRELKVRGQQKEDYTQDCYLSLFQNQEKLDKIEDADKNKFASTICRSTIIDKYRKEKLEVKTDSLSLPKINNKASKISIPDSGITEDQLQEAILLLPYDEYKIVHSLYVEGKTLAETAKDYEITIARVRTKAKRGIIALKNHFEVRNGSL